MNVDFDPNKKIYIKNIEWNWFIKHYLKSLLIEEFKKNDFGIVHDITFEYNLNSKKIDAVVELEWFENENNKYFQENYHDESLVFGLEFEDKTVLHLTL